MKEAFLPEGWVCVCCVNLHIITALQKYEPIGHAGFPFQSFAKTNPVLLKQAHVQGIVMLRQAKVNIFCQYSSQAHIFYLFQLARIKFA